MWVEWGCSCRVIGVDVRMDSSGEIVGIVVLEG